MNYILQIVLIIFGVLIIAGLLALILWTVLDKSSSQCVVTIASPTYPGGNYQATWSSNGSSVPVMNVRLILYDQTDSNKVIMTQNTMGTTMPLSSGAMIRGHTYLLSVVMSNQDGGTICAGSATFVANDI